MMAGKLVRGRLIAVEGGDRCGKSTQCQHILEYCNTHNIPVKYFKFPDRTTAIGRIINEYLQNGRDLSDSAIHLLFSANRWEQSEQIERLLYDGITVVCDRYVPSGIAYTTAKGVDMQWAKQPDHGLLKPDLVLFMEAPVDRVAQRQDYGEERYERVEFQGRVKKVFDLIKDDTWQTVDACLPINKVSEQIDDCLDRFFMNEPREEIEKYNFM